MKTTKGKEMTDWIKWSGGKCPVDGGTLVRIEAPLEGFLHGKAKDFIWEHDDIESNITRYRIVEAEEEAKPANKYSTPIGDVYDVLKAFEVTNPALQHLIKKALKVGNRGHKDIETDLQDIIDSAVRAKQLEGF
tara:strand:+ start:411 stop:812 length:402 start_codon:yes stop_codon:yes gene_type:complete